MWRVVKTAGIKIEYTSPRVFILENSVDKNKIQTLQHCA